MHPGVFQCAGVAEAGAVSRSSNVFTQRVTFRVSRKVETGRGFSGVTRRNLSSLIAVGSEDLRT
jgi:hypothetical protein